MPKAVPDGDHTVTASLTVKDGAVAIDFYPRAFGAREIMRVDAPDGKIMHAEVQIGDFGAVDDPSAHRWGLATHVEDPAPEAMARRQREFFASMAKK